MSAQLAEHTMLTTLSARLVLLSGMGKARALKHYEDMKVRVVCPKVFIHLSLNFEQSQQVEYPLTQCPAHPFPVKQGLHTSFFPT